MAVPAIQGGMRAAEDKPRGTAMIEPGKPAVHAVTSFAIERETGILVIDGSRVEIIVVMAGIAVGPETPELPDGRARMAALAFQRGMRPQKREPVHMSACILCDLAPAANAVAALAVGPQLAAMNIGMTIGALGPDIRKNQLDMTVPTMNAGVHPF
jgi:hypothetical protein